MFFNTFQDGMLMQYVCMYVYTFLLPASQSLPLSTETVEEENIQRERENKKWHGGNEALQSSLPPSPADLVNERAEGECRVHTSTSHHHVCPQREGLRDGEAPG